MAGKWDLRVGDTIEDINENTHTISHSRSGEILCSAEPHECYPMPESNIAKLVSRAPIDLSNMSREQLEELGQRAAVELERRPETDVLYGQKVAGKRWGFSPKQAKSDTHKLTIPNDLPPGTYISSDGNEIKVEEV